MSARTVRVLLLGVAIGVAACGDAGPQSGPGTLTATVVSPNGDEGAAVVEVFGPGITGVASLEGRAFSERRGDTLRVVVVREDGAGTLRFALSVADTTQLFGGTVLEVAGPDDALRSSVATYTLEVVR